jgi:hypothetical protein
MSRSVQMDPQQEAQHRIASERSLRSTSNRSVRPPSTQWSVEAALRNNLRGIFDRAAENGTVSTSALQSLTMELGLGFAAAQMDQLATRVDPNSTGVFDFEALDAALRGVLDVDGDGKLDLGEVLQVAGGFVPERFLGGLEKMTLSTLIDVDLRLLGTFPDDPSAAGSYKVCGPPMVVRKLRQYAQTSSLVSGPLSPRSPVTVPAGARDAIGIPQDAASFAYIYPISDAELMHQLS